MSDEAVEPPAVVEAAPEPVAEAPAPEGEAAPAEPAPSEPASVEAAAPAQAASPAQMVASAEAFYHAQLTKAAEPDPEAKKLREMARQLWQQADAIDGPERMAARQMLMQHNQNRQRQGQQARGAHQGAHAGKPKAG